MLGQAVVDEGKCGLTEITAGLWTSLTGKVTACLVSDVVLSNIKQNRHRRVNVGLARAHRWHKHWKNKHK